MMVGMGYFADFLNAEIKAKTMKRTRLAKLLELTYAAVQNVLKYNRRPTDDFIDRVSKVEELNIPRYRLEAYRALDDYSKEALIEAVRILLSKEK